MADSRQQARGLAAEAIEQGKDVLARQKEAAAKQVDQVAQAVRSTARQLSGDERNNTGHYVEMAAERLESFGRQLREKDLNGFLADAQELARHSPAAFFGGSVLAGFLLARFMKSSSSAQSGSGWQAETPADSADAGEQGWSHPQWSGGPEEVGTPTTSFTGPNTSGGSHADR